MFVTRLRLCGELRGSVNNYKTKYLLEQPLSRADLTETNFHLDSWAAWL